MLHDWTWARFSLKCDIIRACHIVVSRDHSLPEVQQQGKGVVKEATQCDNWKHSSARTLGV